MALVTTYSSEMKEGGFPAIGPKLGWIESKEITLVADSGDTYQVFSLPAGTLILSAGVVVTSAATKKTGQGTTDPIIDIGLSGGTGNELANDINVTTTGLKGGGASTANVLLTSNKGVVISMAGDWATNAKLKVWALVADVKS